MSNTKEKILQIRQDIWDVAREGLDNGEITVYRNLTDMAEKLTMLINTEPEPRESENNKFADMITIFKLYDGKRYEAKIDTNRIKLGEKKCVFWEGNWWSPSMSAIEIKKTSLNAPKNPQTDGWIHFWKYRDESSKTDQTIDTLRKQFGK